MSRAEFWQSRRLRRVVVKVGTSLITDPSAPDGVSAEMLAKLRRELLVLRERGIQTILVSSGAVGAGRHLLHEVFRRPVQARPGIARRQALSMIGQSRLMARYGECFAEADVPVAQLLLTPRDFRDRRAYLNTGHAIQELMGMGALPIVNENDAVSTDELAFGDNDMLSAAVAALFQAELLVILTSVDGFLLNGERVAEITRLDAALRAAALGPEGPGTGGMATKLRAGELSAMAGGALAILPGHHPAPLQALLAGEDLGTLVYGLQARQMSARKRWLLFARTQGGVVVDAGAERALAERGGSLLPAGIRRTRGHFLAGEVIEIEGEDGRYLGRGISNYSYRELQPMLGLSGRAIQNEGLAPRAPEVIHRNNLILESREAGLPG